MKILCIIQCSNLGGMEKVTLESLTVLKDAGHHVEMFSLQPVGSLQSLASDRGIKLKGTARYRLMGLGNIFDILQVIKKSQPDRVWLVGHNAEH